MATMIRCGGLREAKTRANEMLYDPPLADGEDACVYVLRPDGDTHVYRAVPTVGGGHAYFHAREAGWNTRGLHVDRSDTPCIITR